MSRMSELDAERRDQIAHRQAEIEECQREHSAVACSSSRCPSWGKVGCFVVEEVIDRDYHREAQ